MTRACRPATRSRRFAALRDTGWRGLATSQTEASISNQQSAKILQMQQFLHRLEKSLPEKRFSTDLRTTGSSPACVSSGILIRMVLAPGARLGPYEIIALLGAGGMGEVYKARDLRLQRDVAIKVLVGDPPFQRDFRSRLQREAMAAAAVTHPHICTLYDIGQEEGSFFLVMEHLEGETLASRLIRGPLELAEAIDTGVQIAEALSAAHAGRLIHFDLKPGNVMLTRTGAKLLDFGLARIRTDARLQQFSGRPHRTQAGLGW